MAGFVSGEWCFYVSVQKSKTCKTGFVVVLYFTIAQHLRHVKLMNSFVNFFNCGKVKLSRGRSWVSLEVCKSGDIINQIRAAHPFFNLYPIQGVKSADYADFCKVAELVKNKVHLTELGLEQIIKIKDGMNTKRKNG